MSRQAPKQWRDTFQSYIPRWLSNRPSLNVAYRFLWSMLMPLDVAQQVLVEGFRAQLPGLGTPTADPLIGQTRGLLQGEAEAPAHFEARLIQWLAAWFQAGSDEQLATEIQQYLGNTPAVTIVDRSGNWTMLSSSGVFTYATGVSLNWDSTSNPERAGFWSDVWIIITPCEWAATGQTLASLVGTWGTYSGGGTGHACGRAAVDAILGLVATWKGAHTYVRSIVWSYLPGLFDPTNPFSLPDGTWGRWGKVVGTTYVPSRFLDGGGAPICRYWEPANG